MSGKTVSSCTLTMGVQPNAQLDLWPNFSPRPASMANGIRIRGQLRSDRATASEGRFYTCSKCSKLVDRRNLEIFCTIKRGPRNSVKMPG
jgi:hypothetical protein